MITLEMKNYNISALSSGKIDNCEYLTGGYILPPDQSRRTEQANFTYKEKLLKNK